MKGGKRQCKNNDAQSLCWKLHGGAQTFVFCGQIMMKQINATF